MLLLPLLMLMRLPMPFSRRHAIAARLPLPPDDAYYREDYQHAAAMPRHAMMPLADD